MKEVKTLKAEPKVGPKQEKKASSMIAALKVWYLPLISLAIFVGVGIAFLLPWYNDAMAKGEAVKKAQADKAKLIPKLETLVKEDQETLTGYLVDLNLVVPSEVSPPLILATLEKAVNDATLSLASLQFQGLSGLTQENINVTSPVQGSGPPVPTGSPIVDQSVKSSDLQKLANESLSLQGGDIGVQLSARGDMYQIVDFLKTIQEASPLVLATGFTVKGIQTTIVRSADGQTNEVVEVPTKEFSYSGTAPFQNLPDDLGSLTKDIKNLSKEDLELLKKLDGYQSLLPVSNDQSPTAPVYNKGKANPF
jgi:hypothetical protein